MMAAPITFDLGGFPPIEFQLASSEGLAPLPLPQSLPQPLPDAVRLFQAAMERDEGEVTRGVAETQRAARGEVFQTGLTGLTGFEKTVESSETPRTGEVVTKPDFAPLGVENTIRPENPVNPVQKEVPTEINTAAGNAPVVPQAGEFVSRGVAESEVSRGAAETQRAVRGEVFQTGLTGLTGFEKVVNPSTAPRTGEVVTKPDFAPIGVDQTPRPANPVHPEDDVPQSTSLPQPGSETRESAPISATAANPAPLRAIDTDATDAPIVPQAGDAARGVAGGEVSRGDAETQRAVRGEVFQTGWAGLTGFEKVVNPSTAPRTGEVVTKPEFAPIGVDQTPRPENPLLPANEASQSTLLPQTGSETREAAPISATAANPAPLRAIDTDATDAPIVPQAGDAARGVAGGEVSRGVAETQRAVRGEVFQTGWAGLTGFEKVVNPSTAPRTGEVVTQPDFAPIGVDQTPRPENPLLPANEASQSTSLPQTGSETREAAPISATAANPAPLRAIDTDAADAPIVPQAGDAARGVAGGEVSRGVAETQRAVGGEVFQTGLTGLTGFEKIVEPSETPRTGEVVTQPDFAPIGVENTPRPENPVNLVHPVQKEVPTELNTVAVDAPVVPLREMEDGAVEAPAALPSVAQPTPLAAASEFPEVQQVAAAQSARTEAVAATVAQMVETVNQIVEAVAAEIAVSPTLASGNGDIRITLKPTVLDGSEIRLTAQSGELTVSIAPATPAAAALAAAALPRLETALAEHAPSFHHVAVVVATARKGKEK